MITTIQIVLGAAFGAMTWHFLISGSFNKYIKILGTLLILALMCALVQAMTHSTQAEWFFLLGALLYIAGAALTKYLLKRKDRQNAKAWETEIHGM